jgi:hypothetical protein
MESVSRVIMAPFEARPSGSISACADIPQKAGTSPSATPSHTKRCILAPQGV